VAAGKEKLQAVGIPNYPSPDRAVTAFRAMCDTRVAAAVRRIVTRFPVNRRRVDRIINLQTRNGTPQMAKSRRRKFARLRLQCAGRPTGPHQRRCGGNSERIGYPVVLKFPRRTSSTNPISAACAFNLPTRAGARRV